MANDFFTNTVDLEPGKKARAGAVEANFSQVEQGFDRVAQRAMAFAIESGSGNDFVLTLNPQPTVMPASGTFVFQSSHANSGAATIRIGALAPVSLLDSTGAALTASSIVSGEVVVVHYNGAACRVAGVTKSYADSLSFSSSLPAQGGNAGKMIVTDGAAASWGNAINHLAVLAGALATPSIRIGDTDSGLYAPATGEVGVVINGAEALRLTGAGMSIAGTEKRVTADFSNATASNRAAFMSSTTNGATILSAVPNGSGASSALHLSNAASPDNTSSARVSMDASQMAVSSDRNGSGTYLPMVFYTNGVERLRLLTGGGVAFGGAANFGSAGQALLSAGAGAVPTWGTLPLVSGGTGATTAGAARTALLAASSGANADVTSLSVITGIGSGNTTDIILDGSGNVALGNSGTGPAGVLLPSNKNIAFAEGSGQAYATVFRQAANGSTVIGSGVKYSNTASAMASSINQTWAKAAVEVGFNGIKFYHNQNSVTFAGNDVTMAEQFRIVNGGLRYSTIPGYVGMYGQYDCRAWCVFNVSSGVVSMTGGLANNVGSITDFGVGDFGINFAIAMPDTLFSVVMSAGNVNVGTNPYCVSEQSRSVSQVRATCFWVTNGAVDPAVVSFALFR
jgi:hypothetical protein